MIQVNVEVGVTVNQYEEQSVTFKELRMPGIPSAITHESDKKRQSHETENPTGN